MTTTPVPKATARAVASVFGRLRDTMRAEWRIPFATMSEAEITALAPWCALYRRALRKAAQQPQQPRRTRR